jgi:AraC-like DNA-binding protein
MEEVRAWRPPVPGIREVFHAHFVDHAYPMHTHDAWTLLIVDSGAVQYDLDHSAHGTRRSEVTLLPPHVPHDGRAATRDGFRKRVLYLDPSLLDASTIGPAVDSPGVVDPALRDRVDRLHRALSTPGDEFEAESRLAFVRDRLIAHLSPHSLSSARTGSRRLADQLRMLLEANTVGGLTLRDAAAHLVVHPTSLVRAFSSTFGLAPHAFLTGRRIDLARKLLLDGMPVAEVAVAAGFYDQAHLTRHFRRYLAVTPARYAAGRTLAGAPY